MHFTPRLMEAVNLCARLHREQTRRDNEKTPYFSHLFSVMYIVSQTTEDEDVLIASLMHDSLEDVPGYTYERLVEDCGERVANLVRGVTEPLDANKEEDEQLPWLVRKEAYLKTLQEATKESVLISCADKLHNLMSFRQAILIRDEAMFTRILSSLHNQLFFYEKVYTLGKERLGEETPLIKAFRDILDDVTRLSSSHGE